MSALPPKADIVHGGDWVRLVPQADPARTNLKPPRDHTLSLSNLTDAAL